MDQKFDNSTQPKCCLLCKQPMKSVMEVWDLDGKSQVVCQPDCGGEIRISFDFGSRYDWMGSRNPTYDKTKPEDWTEIDLLGDGNIQSFANPTGSKPDENVLQMTERCKRLSACSHILAIMCDDCFEKNAEHFYGYEKDPESNVLTRLV